MASLDLKRKLTILADAAKYDASCASSGGRTRSSRDGRGVGATTGGMGICHVFTPDGRCVSLLKILLTNFCLYDCAYCVNRISSNVDRARFSVEEVVQLTLDFYKRNYIEGLFLSSGVIRSADYTQEELNRVAKTLRESHDFRGYIHLKLVAGASPELVAEAGRHADRVSVNIELPRDDAFARLAPEKRTEDIRQAMATARLGVEAAQDRTLSDLAAPPYAPAGQSTQMIVGADGASDADILARSEGLYGAYRLRRVYYSAFSPIPDSSPTLPSVRPPLLREHRLYQADWMMRHYGFTQAEIVAAAPGGMLELERDPKLAWALANRRRFPVDVNRAAREMLLRIPGLGVRSIDRLLEIRALKAIRLEDLRRLTRSTKRLLPFVITADWRPRTTDRLDLGADLAESSARPVQMSLF